MSPPLTSTTVPRIVHVEPLKRARLTWRVRALRLRAVAASVATLALGLGTLFTLIGVGGLFAFVLSLSSLPSWSALGPGAVAAALLLVETGFGVAFLRLAGEAGRRALGLRGRRAARTTSRPA